MEKKKEDTVVKTPVAKTPAVETPIVETVDRFPGHGTRAFRQ